MFISESYFFQSHTAATQITLQRVPSTASSKSCEDWGQELELERASEFRKTVVLIGSISDEAFFSSNPIYLAHGFGGGKIFCIGRRRSFCIWNLGIRLLILHWNHKLDIGSFSDKIRHTETNIIFLVCPWDRLAHLFVWCGQHGQIFGRHAGSLKFNTRNEESISLCTVISTIYLHIDWYVTSNKNMNLIKGKCMKIQITTQAKLSIILVHFKEMN